MKTLDDLKWEIKNSELIKLNNLRIKLNEDSELHEYHIFDSSIDPAVINPHTLNRIRRRIKEIKKRAGKIKSNKLSLFDRIVLADIKNTISDLDAYHSFFNPVNLENDNGFNFSEVLTKLFGSFYGNAVYTKIVNMFAKLDYKMHDKYTKTMSKIEGYSFDPDLERIREKAKQLVPHFIETAKSFANETGLYEHDITFEAELTPITQTSSSWHPELEQMCLDAARLNFVRIDNKERLYGSAMYIIAIHEYAHALQEHLSKKALPDGMNAKQKGMHSLTQGMLSEGTAVATEKPAIAWVNKNRKKLKLTKEDIELIKMFVPMYLQTKIPNICHDIFELKENLAKKDFDAHEELAKISSCARYKTDTHIFGDTQISNSLFQLNYVLGNDYISNLLTELRRKYSTGSVRKNMPVLMRGMLTASALRPNAHRLFMLKEYIPKAQKLGYLK